MKKTILLDTNFLMIPAQFGVDIFSHLKEHNIIIPNACMHELRKIAAGKGKNAAAARTTLKILERKKIKIINTGQKNADSGIINYAKNHDCIVATNDKKLIKVLLANKINIARLKQKKYISLE